MAEGEYRWWGLCNKVMNIGLGSIKGGEYLGQLSDYKLFSGTALGYGLDDRGFESRQRPGISFTTASRTVLEPTQPPIQCVPGPLSLGVKRPAA